MKLQRTRQQRGTGKPAASDNGKTGTFSPWNMGNGVYDRLFMLEIAFDHEAWRRMMIPYGVGADRMESRPHGRGFTALFGVVDPDARERQRIIDEYGGNNE